MSFKDVWGSQVNPSNASSERSKRSAAHQTPRGHSHEAGDKMLETSSQTIGAMRHHVLMCAERWIHGRNIELKIAELENQLADICRARRLMRNILGDMAMHSSWSLVVKLMDSCEAVTKDIFHDSAKDMLERVHTFHRQKLFDHCHQGAAGVAKSNRQDSRSRNTTTQQGTMLPPRGQGDSMEGRAIEVKTKAGDPYTPPPNPSRPKTPAKPTRMRHFRQFGPGSDRVLMTAAEFYRIEEACMKNKEASVLGGVGNVVPRNNRPPMGKPGNMSARESPVLSPINSNEEGLPSLRKTATTTFKIEVSTNKSSDHNQFSNKVISVEELCHRSSSNRSKESTSLDISTEESTLKDQSDAHSEASSISLDAKGFLEARERSVRAEKCTEKIEAKITEWKMNVAKEQIRRAAVQAAKREEEAFGPANFKGRTQCTDAWW
ncbi:hypothetical protein H2200_000368 [Cladophialophora chaetospira]|uniref:Uncharacterized protein n=1 Tax=Cladophialophora chaetospira TaxID=386627 RepID=A0AA38XPC0_9EURO|nr:hypothetical protein H2200_000368 [Cladophialophora chaetospira]